MGVRTRSRQKLCYSIFNAPQGATRVPGDPYRSARTMSVTNSKCKDKSNVRSGAKGQDRTARVYVITGVVDIVYIPAYDQWRV